MVVEAQTFLWETSALDFEDGGLQVGNVAQRRFWRAYADWTQLERRVSLYDDAVIKRANETADASISAYGGGLADFPELIRSQLAELDAELKRLELRIERAKAWARLSYLAGDEQ